MSNETKQETKIDPGLSMTPQERQRFNRLMLEAWAAGSKCLEQACTRRGELLQEEMQAHGVTRERLRLMHNATLSMLTAAGEKVDGGFEDHARRLQEYAELTLNRKMAEYRPEDAIADSVANIHRLADGERLAAARRVFNAFAVSELWSEDARPDAWQQLAEEAARIRAAQTHEDFPVGRTVAEDVAVRKGGA